MSDIKTYLKKSFMYAALAVNAVTLSSSAIHTYDTFNDEANGVDFNVVNATAATLSSPLSQGMDWATGGAAPEGFHTTPNSWMAAQASGLLNGAGFTERETALIASIPGVVETTIGAPGAMVGSIFGSITYAVKTAMRP